MNNQDKKILTAFSAMAEFLAKHKGECLDTWLKLNFSNGLVDIDVTIFNAEVSSNRSFYAFSDHKNVTESIEKIKKALTAAKNKDFNEIIRLSGHRAEEAEQAA